MRVSRLLCGLSCGTSVGRRNRCRCGHRRPSCSRPPRSRPRRRSARMSRRDRVEEPPGQLLDLRPAQPVRRGSVGSVGGAGGRPRRPGCGLRRGGPDGHPGDPGVRRGTLDRLGPGLRAARPGTPRGRAGWHPYGGRRGSDGSGTAPGGLPAAVGPRAARARPASPDAVRVRERRPPTGAPRAGGAGRRVAARDAVAGHAAGHRSGGLVRRRDGRHGRGRRGRRGASDESAWSASPADGPRRGPVAAERWTVAPAVGTPRGARLRGTGAPSVTGACPGRLRLCHVAPPGGRDDRAGRSAARRHRGPRKPFGGAGVDAQGPVREQGACSLDPEGGRGPGRGCRAAGAVCRRRAVPGDGPDAYRGRGSGGGRALDGGGAGPGRGRGEFGGPVGNGGARPHGHRGGWGRRCRGGARVPVRVRARHGRRKVTRATERHRRAGRSAAARGAAHRSRRAPGGRRSGGRPARAAPRGRGRTDSTTAGAVPVARPDRRTKARISRVPRVLGVLRVLGLEGSTA
ncbi:hypothetical protein SBADM41S_07330 [Streptomyces badius]